MKFGIRSSILYGYYGYGNFGDDLFLWFLTKQLPTWFCSSRFVVPIRGGKTVPREVLAKIGTDVEFKHFKYENRIQRFISKVRMACYLMTCNFLIFGGGTFLYRKTSTDTRNLIALLNQIKLAKASGAQVIGLGLGMDPISDERTRYVAKRIVESFDLLVLRDSESLKNIKAVVPNDRLPRTYILPDLAYGLRDELLASSVPKRDGYIGVNFALPPGCTNASELISHLRIVFERIRSAGKYKIKYVIAQRDLGSREGKLLSKIAPDFDPDDVICYNGSIRNFVKQFSQLETILACKLHILVLAHILAKPFIALQYQEKIANFMKEIDYEDNLFRYAEVDQAVDILLSSKTRFPGVESERLSKTLEKGLERLLA